MRKCALAIAAVFGLGLAAGGLSAARAATIDTFDFTQAGWLVSMPLVGGQVIAGAPDPGGMLTGSFTGTVEPSGLIELGDLTSFSDTYANSSFTVAVQDLADLTLFSYDTKGGASTLDIAGEVGLEQTCVGAAVSLDSNCSEMFDLTFPVGTNGAVFAIKGQPFAFTSAQPTITLVSSVTTPPPGSVPEPSSLSLFVTFLAGELGVTGWVGRRRHVALDPA